MGRNTALASQHAGSARRSTFPGVKSRAERIASQPSAISFLPDVGCRGGIAAVSRSTAGLGSGRPDRRAEPARSRYRIGRDPASSMMRFGRLEREGEPEPVGGGMTGGRRSVEGRPLDESESRLVERAQRGEVDAYEAIVRRYQELAFRVAYLITGSAAEAEEAAQEGFVRAYYALGRFRREAPLRPWLLRIVANAARNRRAASARRPTVPLALAADRASDDRARSPEAAALAAEQGRELLAALAALGEDDRAVIGYRYFLDLSEAEMADVLGCARGTVKSRLSRAMARLRRQLAAATPAPAPPGGIADG